MARAGRFNVQVTIQQKSVTQDTTWGTEVVTWTALDTVWADVQDILPSRSEAVQQGLSVGRQQVRIRIRYRTDVTSAMRIVVHDESDETYQIVGGPAELGNRDQIEMVCEKFTS